MDVFEYDNTTSYQSNFTRWHSMNSSERSNYNEELLTTEQARIKFEEMYKEELRSYGATILSKISS